MARSRIDLHIHSTVSDGTLTPREVVETAAAEGVRLLAIADHDTTDGLPEAAEAARAAGLDFVPAVELSVGTYSYEVHMLGYFIRYDHPEAQATLSWLRRARDERNEGIVRRLQELGAGIDMARVQEIAGGGSVGRPHIAAALVEAGRVKSVKEAFQRYLGRGKAAYVPRERLSPEKACEMIRAAGGLPVLAHPAKLPHNGALEALLAFDIAGLEAYHCDHSARDSAELVALARERGLLVTGGSDSHGPRSDRPIPIGGVHVPDWVGEELLARAPDWWAKSR